MLGVPGFLGRVLGPGGVPVGTGFQVAPGIVVTAWHVLAEAGADRVGARVRVDALDGSGNPIETEVIGGDARRDLAVLRGAEELPETVAGLAPTGSVELLTPVVVTGVSVVDDLGHTYRHLDATGVWQGGTVRDGDVALGRLTSTAVVPGMSGAPVLRLSDNAAVGVVSARYNSADGWLRDSVWVARVEDLTGLLDGLPGVGLSRRVMLAEPVRTVLSVQASGAITLSTRTAGVAARPQGGAHESALEAARVLIALDDSCRGLGELGDLAESLVGAVVDGRTAPGFRTRLRRRGLDPRLLFQGIAGHDEALRRWAAPLEDGDGSGPEAAGLLTGLKRALVDELGTEMFAGLSEACRRFLREALLDAGSAGLAAFLHAVAGLLPPLRSISVEAVPAALGLSTGDTLGRYRRDVATIAAQMCRLPEPRPYFAGRSEIVDRIARAVERRIESHGSATVFLSGQPGVGTSLVAVESARRLIPAFPGGVLHVDLNGLVADARRDAPTVVRTVAEALGVDLGSETTDDARRFAALVAGLRGRRVLLVLDNALNAAHVAPLVKLPSGCGIMVTSRDRVQSYADPGLVFRVEPLARDDSVRLLAAFAEGRAPETALLHRIAHLCADVPMALEMIGARIASRPDLRLDYLARVLEEESTRLDYLDDGDRAVRVAIKLSYDNLDAATQRVFRLMAAAPGAGTTGGELGHCLDERPLQQELLLNRLVDRSLADQEIVSSVSGDVLATFTLFDLVLLFAKERLAEEPGDDVRGFQERAVSYLHDRLDEIVRRQAGAELAGELDPSRFHAATRLADERGWFGLALALADDLHELYESRGELDSALANDETRIHLHLRQGDADSAVTVCLGNADALRSRNPELAVEYARRAARLAQEHGMPARAAGADFKLSILLWNREDLAGALAAGERAASVLTAIGQDAVAVPIAINNARLAREAAENGKALDWARRATELADRWAGGPVRASAFFERNRAELVAGKNKEALDSARRAEALYRDDGNWSNAAVACENGALAAERMGKGSVAVELRETAVGHRERPDDLPRLVKSLVDLSALHMRRNSYESARRVLARAIEARRAKPGSAMPALLDVEVLARHAAVLLFVGTGRHPAGTDLAEPGAVAAATGDAELERVQAVLKSFYDGVVDVEEARRRTREVLVSETRNPPSPVANWLHEELGAQRPDQPMLEPG